MSDFADCEIWNEIFDLTKSGFDNLVSQIAFYDYAILIATADDVVESRGSTHSAMRDNVLFEFGLFTGGLGKTRALLVLEEDVKVLSDLSGITVSFIPPKKKKGFDQKVDEVVKKIKEHIINKEQTFDLGFLPAMVLAYGYFKNFLERTIELLLKDKKDGKKYTLSNGADFVADKLEVTVLLPDDLSNNMFAKVQAKRLRDGWEKIKVDPQSVRDFDFSIDVSKVSDGCMHLVDIPLTLNGLNLAIELYSQKSHLGKSAKENLLEKREVRNFKRTLEYLINNSPLTKDFVKVEVVNI